jgi:hypothetical protein
MKQKSIASQNISRMYEGLDLNCSAVTHKAKLLLKIYRDVVWVTVRHANNLRTEAHDAYGSKKLSTALAYLSDFAPTEHRKDFEAKVTRLFETTWLVGIIDKAMSHVYNYHCDGKLYHEILSKSYLTAARWSESELLDALHLERSIFYERKREAVMLLGISLWGYAIPESKSYHNDDNDNCDVV